MSRFESKSGWSLRASRRAVATLLALAACGAALAATALAQMQTLRLGPELCRTTRGGKFVDIPGFPGEKIDRRLLADVRWMVRTYDIFITDGYSLDPVHAPNGEHPIGLALDIVPNKARGGTWRQVAHLARWAEPKQNQPQAPFRWVGWNGDSGHGRGHHLHLSWLHSPTEFDDPARVVYTRRCPEPPEEGPTGPTGPTGPEGDPDGPTGETPPSDGTGGGPPAPENGEGGIEPLKVNHDRNGSGGVRVPPAERRRIHRLQTTGPYHD